MDLKNLTPEQWKMITELMELGLGEMAGMTGKEYMQDEFDKYAALFHSVLNARQ